MNTPKNKQSQNKENECSDIWICSQAVQDSPKQQSDLGEYRQLNLWKSTPMPNESSDTTSHISPSTQTSETITQSQENSTLLQWAGRVQAHQTQELSKDSNIQLPHSGEKDLDAYWSFDPSSVFLNNLKDLSDEDLELFLPPSIWQDTVLRLKQSRRESLEHHTKDSECLFFPTLTSNECFTSRPAGQTKCEKWFKDKGLIPSGSQLIAQAIAMIMGFPPNWFDCLSQVKPQEESEQGISQVEPLHQHKQRSLYLEFSTCPSCKAQTIKLTEGCGICGWLGCDFLLGNKSAKTEIPVTDIPCLIKQPDRPELKGVIRKDLGDRFDVYIPHLDKSIAYLKLFVYPDFDKSAGTLLGGLNKSSSKNLHDSNKKVSDTSVKCSSKTIPPCTKSSSKKRRHKGEGSGHIYYRTVTRNGKEYRQAYYQWRENGKQKTKYIPKKLLNKVEEAEHRKYPVTDILELLLGGLNKCSSKSSGTFPDLEVLAKDESVETISNCSSKIDNPPCKRQKRPNGHGGGYIEYREVKRNHKVYAQYWYHWEIWWEGDRLTKKSRYIPKRLLAKIERMNNEKLPVEEILKVLKYKKKKK